MKIQMTRCLCCCVASILGLVAVPAFGSSFTLSDLNSVAVVTPTSQAGMQSWTVDGVNDLAQQWFWYGIGSGSVSSIDTLGPPTVTQSSSSSLTLMYAGPGLSATVSYFMTGGAPGSNTSDIGENIKLQNTSASSEALHFYQYSNFQLGGGTTSNFLQFSNANAVDQTNMTLQLSETAETVDTPAPNAWQGGAYPSILNVLNAGTAVTLNDTPAIGTQIGPGNMSWAYEWDKTLAPNATLTIAKEKNIEAVPEPGTLAILGLCIVSVCAGLRTRRRT